MDLTELIDAHRGGRSYTELARDCGGSPTSKRLQQMARQPIKNFPDPPTVRALAKGLRVSQEAVLMAAAESLGLDVRSSLPRVVELLPAAARDLTEQQAAAVAHLVRTIVDEQPRTMSPVDADGAPAEPTVTGVLAAREERDQLRAVAEQGDPDDVDAVEEKARQARRRQTGKDD